MLPNDKIDALVARVDHIDRRMAQPADAETLVRLARERSQLAPVYEAISDLRRVETERNRTSNPSSMTPIWLHLPRDEAGQTRQPHRGTHPGHPHTSCAQGRSRREKRDPGNPCRDRRQRGGLIRRRPVPYVSAARRFAWLAYADPVGKCRRGRRLQGNVANVAGQGVFARLKFESGVHRVQRFRRPKPVAVSTPRRQPLRFCRRPKTLISTSSRRICG